MKATINSVFLGALLGAALVAAPAAAQSNDDGRVRYETMPGYGGEGMPYRDCSLPDSEMSASDEVSSSPARRQDMTTSSGISIEEAERLRAQRRTILGGQIDQFNQLLSTMQPNYPNRPVILFRKAEALRELADADYMAVRARFNECMNNWYACASDSECYEPVPDYTEAIREYGEIARNHPDYDRLDEVIFRLGETLMENGDGSTANTYLTRLVSTYPSSQYIPDAYLLMAEYQFDQDLLTAARGNYEQVLNHPQSPLYDYSIYKIGWVDINQGQYEDALTRFQTVIRNIDGGRTESADFRNQALNDMVRVYAELDNGWQRARDYFRNLEGEDYMRRKLTQLAGLFDDQGKDELRLEVLTFFLGEYPNDQKVPQWAEESIDSLVKIGNWERTEQSVRRFITMLEPTSRWTLSNQGNERELSTARLNSEAWLLMLITRNEQEARRFTNPEVKRRLWEQVATDYEEFFRRFPDSREAYDQRFYYAEILFQQLANAGDCNPRGGGHFVSETECLGYLRQAGDQFRNVVELQPDPAAEHTYASATGALLVYDRFMSATNPQVDRDLPAPGDYGQFFDNQTELNEDATNYVEIVAWFAELYPEDEQIPAASWRAASLFLYAGRIGEAAARFETIIEHHPNHRFAQQAALAAFVCYNQEENWVKIESVARRLLESCRGDNRICQRDSLQQAVAYAMNNQASDLVEAGNRARIESGERAAMPLYLQAAEKRVALYREFPESEWAAVALMNAAATYEQARQIRTSIDLYNEFLERYPQHEMVPEALYTLGLIHESQANFAEAADWFERVDAFASYDNRAEAVLQAGRLREALSEFDAAVRLYEHYLSLNDDVDTSKEVYFQLANLERSRNNLDAAFARYESFLSAYSNDPFRRLLAKYNQAAIRLEQGRGSDALTLYGQVYDMFGRGIPNFNERNEFSGWSQAPGGNFAESERARAIPFAAEAAFRLAEVDYERAKAADLTYRAGRTNELVAKLVARGEAIERGQQALVAAYNVGDAQWAVASLVRVGQLYKDFFRDLYETSAFDYDDCLRQTRDNFDMCDEAEGAIEGVLFEYGAQLEDRAMAAWYAARDVATANGVYTEWTRLLVTEMNDTDRSFRLGGAEGVEASQVSDPYISTRYILDLSDKLAAFEDFVPPTPALQLPGEPGGEAAPDATEVPSGDFGTGM